MKNATTIIKRPAAILLVLLIALGLVACGSGAGNDSAAQGPAANNTAGNTTEGSAPGVSSSDNASATYIFTDSAGREVEIPRNIERIAPSGPLAQVVLITLCPDKLVGLSSGISDQQFEYIDSKYSSLPVLGNFYADTLNLESVILAAPQVVIDIGESKPNNTDDLDSIQERTGIPTIFIQMEMGTMLEAYQTLGELTGETEQARRLNDYISQTLSETAEKVNNIPESARLRVYYGQDDGLTGMVSGTVHTDVIDFAGGYNVVVLEQTLRGGAATISMEQLMLWDPEVVLLTPASIYDSIGTNPDWGGISAVRNGRYYEIPEGPYNWMGRPPSVNRILGIKWLSNLLYPDIFNYDMASEMREFYRLFYHCELTDAQINNLLANSTYK